ncbi:MAG: HutD family protein [Alphaproteobacteria bacterium]|nr:HutD family protein [Alphaproteobacteria bacterium]
MERRFRLIGPARHRRVPWKNGGGWTTELASDAGADGRFGWRLSLADVEKSGPFSRFPGIDRTIMLVEGRGFLLSVAGAPPVRIARPFAPFAFDGGVSTDCRLIAGPVRDFNLMVERTRHRAACAVIAPGRHVLALPARGTELLHAIGAARLAGLPGGRRQDLGPGDTLVISGEGALALMLEVAPGAPLFRASLAPC